MPSDKRGSILGLCVSLPSCYILVRSHIDSDPVNLARVQASCRISGKPYRVKLLSESVKHEGCRGRGRA